MAPIASLVVRLSAQIAEFQKSFADGTKVVDDFKSSFEKSAASIQSTVDGIAKTFSSFGSLVGTIGVAVAGVTAAAAAFTVAFKAVQGAVDTVGSFIQNAVSKTADLGDALFSLSQKTSLSVESLSGFKFVAAQTNTSLESITGAVFKLETNLGAGAKKTTEALAGIGLSLKTLRGEDPAQAFTEIITKLGELPNASARAAAGVAIFGKSFKDIAQLSQENLPALIQQAKDLGVVMSQETAVAADRFHDALGAISAASQGLQQQIGAKLLPAAVAFAEVFGGIFIDAIKQVTGSTKNLGEGFDQFVVFLGQVAARFIEVLARMVEATAQWAADISKRIAEETRDFLDLAPSIITVGKALDLALGGGSHQSAFDALSKNLQALRKPLDALASGAVAAGNTIRDFAKGIETAAKGAGDNFGSTFARIQGEIATSADKMRQSLKAVGDGGVEGASKAKDAFGSFSKQLGDLTAQIDRAKANGTPLAQLVKLFGDEAAKATPKAHAWGIAVADSVEEVSRAFNELAREKIFDKLDDGLEKFARTLERTQFKKLQADMHESAIAIVEWAKLVDKANDSILKLGESLAKKQFAKLADGMHESVDAVVAGIHPIKDAFEELGKQLPDLLFGALKSGGGISEFILAGATAVGASFGKVFKDALEASIKAGKPLTLGEKGVGLAAVGADAFVSSFGLGQTTGSKGKGAASGAAAGAAAGIPLAGATGGLSILVGAGIGALGGFLGGRKAEKEAKAALEQNKIALAQQFGGMEKLRALAEKLGVNIQSAFDAKKPAQFQAAVDKLNAALEQQEKRTAGLAKALENVNARTATFAKQFSGLVETKKGGGDEGADAAQKIQELAQRTQPEFERLGLFVRDTFAGIVKDTGNAFDALQQLAPSFEVLKSGITDFGLTSTGVIDTLLESFDLVNNEAFKPLFENIQSTGQLFQGLFDAKALSPEGFQAAAADIGQSIQEIIDRGGDIAKTLALSAPQLQALFEAQERFGGVTDQTTKSILAQAEAQGVVGEKFKSVNDKILDVLLEIDGLLGGKLPADFAALSRPAQDAADSIKGSFAGAFDETGANIETKIGRKLQDLGIPAAQGGQAARDALSASFDEAATAVDRSIAQSLLDLKTPADISASGVSQSFGAAFDQTAANIDFKIGRSLTGLSTKARDAAAGVSLELGKIRAPEITIPVTVDLDASAIDRFNNSDPRIQFGFDVPELGRGGIVRQRTLAIVGESGPEAVVPLSGGSNIHPISGGGGTAVINIDGRTVARVVVPHIPGEVSRYGLGRGH